MGVVPLHVPSVLVRVCPSRAVPEMLGGVALEGAVGGGGATVTVMAAVPGRPSLVAVMVAGPAATPVTSPLAETVATPLALVVHVTGRPVSTLPLASRSVAASCTVAPTCTLAGVGVTVTVATGGGGGGGGAVTVSVADAVRDPTLPEIVADPAARPTANPPDR